MKYFLIILTSFFIFGCQHAPIQNKLLGTWRIDPQRTLSELPQGSSDALARITTVTKWLANRKCGSTMVIYEKDSYRTIVEGISDVTAPYKVIESRDQYILIDQFENFGIIKINFVKDGFYVNEESDGMAYKGYFTNVPCPE